MTPPTPPADGAVPEHPPQFRTTHWSVVLMAGRGNSGAAQEALTRLCGFYWYPLYAFVRRRGHNSHDAQDLTQDFFAHLLEKKILEAADQQKGRFRSFLLASVKNFLANEWDRNHTVKRGGKHSIISWDDQSGENRYLREPFHEVTPERLFEQSWALTVIQNALEQLRKEYADAGKSQLFEAIQAYLSEDEGAETYASMATRLKLTEAAVKMSVLRLRRHFRELLRAEIAQTVGDPGELDEEVRHLFTALAG